MRPAALMKLRPEGQRLVTPELASGAVPEWAPEVWGEVSAPFGREVSLETFHAMVDLTFSQRGRFDPSIDAFAAARLHRALPLTRREAADVGVWRWLAVAARPDFVRYRWENTAWAQMQSRFLRGGTRPDSNAIGRLWWIAELCRDGDDYRLAERVLQRQTLANAIFIRSLSYYRPAISACVSVLEGATSEQLERSLLELNRWLSVTALEGLSEAELVAALTQHAR
ncbi:MAG: hypothetical protein JNK82_04030 [Myxococcaceae bacterium]|nr:hypothetical protein [Myxococcaceae bacterium]